MSKRVKVGNHGVLILADLFFQLLYTFDGTTVDDGLTCTEGDVVEILEDCGDWLWCSLNGTVRRVCEAGADRRIGSCIFLPNAFRKDMCPTTTLPPSRACPVGAEWRRQSRRWHVKRIVIAPAGTIGSH